jgi:hypothetical protein
MRFEEISLMHSIRSTKSGHRFSWHSDDRPTHRRLRGSFAGFFTGLSCSVALCSFVFCFLAFGSGLPQGGSLWGFQRNCDDNPSSDLHPQRPIGQVRRDVQAFVKNSKQTEDLRLQVGAIVDLCAIHHEIVTDPRFAANSSLQSLRAVAAKRLKDYRKYLAIEITRQNRMLSGKKKADANSTSEITASGNTAGTDTASGKVDGTSPPQQNDADILLASDPPDLDEVLYDSMAGGMYTMGRFVGGPAQVWGYVHGNFAPPWDHGEELVRLIENTINPDFWRTNGGDGSLHYFQPLRILVVSASSQVHDDLTDFLRLMRSLH